MFITVSKYTSWEPLELRLEIYFLSVQKDPCAVQGPLSLQQDPTPSPRDTTKATSLTPSKLPPPFFSFFVYNALPLARCPTCAIHTRLPNATVSSHSAMVIRLHLRCDPYEQYELPALTIANKFYNQHIAQKISQCPVIRYATWRYTGLAMRDVRSELYQIQKFGSAWFWVLYNLSLYIRGVAEK